jgi:hypothetical protein
MTFYITYIQDSFVDEIYDKAIKNLNLFFGFNWEHNQPKIFILPNRKTIDLFKGESTPEWVTGWADGNNIFLLSREYWNENTSEPYKDEYYEALIIHELTHLFVNFYTKNNYKPQWINEGIALYLAGQNKFRQKPKQFKIFLDCFDNNKPNINVYAESGFAVQILIEKYGKKQFIKLLKQLSKINSKNDFEKIFKKIYKFEATYINFNQFLK